MLDDTKQVLWTQGLFMQPQHFQTADLSFDARLRSYRRTAEPWPWGFYDLKLSIPALQNNQIAIFNLHAVFQDGSEVAVPGNAAVKARSFADAWTQADRPFMTYLGLRRHNPAGGNVTSYEEGEEPRRDKGDHAFTRHVSAYSPQPVPDSHGEGPAEIVRTLEYSLNIFWESEIGDFPDCDFLPLARLMRVGDGVSLDAAFVPPALDLKAFPPLRQVVVDVRDQLLGRAARLEEYKPAEGRLEQWSGDARAFSMLLTLLLLNRNIPSLDFVANTDNMRPWAAYLAIRQLAAELTGLVAGINAMGESERGEKLLPAYNHADPAPCFQKAGNLVSSLLSRLASGPEHLIRMERSDTGILEATPPEAFFSPEFRHYLMVRSGVKPEQIRVEVARFGKLCSLASLSNIVNQALPGIPLRPLDHPPTGLPRRSDTSYFEISAASPLWHELHSLDNQTMAFLWDGGGEDMVVHLAAMRIH